MTTATDDPSPDPLFSVTKGSPTDEELAAVLVVLSSLSGSGSGQPAEPSVSGWSAYWRSVRPPLQPGPGVWRMSGRV